MSDLTYSFQYEDVILSALFAIVGAYASMECCTIARRSMSHAGKVRWLSAAAFCFGYSTVFTMHYVGMTAVHMYLPTGEALPILFSLPLILLSIPFSTVPTFIAMYRLRNMDPQSLVHNKFRIALSGVITAVGVGIMHVSFLLCLCRDE
jgi:NO-binding membrane sensor protein with MHYT domain